MLQASDIFFKSISSPIFPPGPFSDLFIYLFFKILFVSYFVLRTVEAEQTIILKTKIEARIGEISGREYLDNITYNSNIRLSHKSYYIILLCPYSQLLIAM